MAQAIPAVALAGGMLANESSSAIGSVINSIFSIIRTVISYIMEFIRRFVGWVANHPLATLLLVGNFIIWIT